jgi:hypothetical protein
MKDNSLKDKSKDLELYSLRMVKNLADVLKREWHKVMVLIIKMMETV